MHGYSFGTPSCASMGLARRAASCVTSVSCTHDIVPSLSVHAVDRLCKTIELEMPQSKAKKPKEVGASKPYTHDKAVACTRLAGCWSWGGMKAAALRAEEPPENLPGRILHSQAWN